MVSRLDAAIRKAAKYHKGQLRFGDSPLPYIIHPVEVMVNLRHVGGVTDEDMLIAAALHDTIEECNAKPAAIEKEFGPRVRELVVELTRYEPTKEEREGLNPAEIWELRSKLLLDEIAQMSCEAQTIKLADRLSNIQESARTKAGPRLERYLGQTHRILEIVPRTVNPGLWDAIRDFLERVEGVART